MKRIALFSFLSLALVAQANAEPAAPDQQLLAVIKEIQAQQATMAENQAKIDAQLASLTEAIRVAKIYSSRGGR